MKWRKCAKALFTFALRRVRRVKLLTNYLVAGKFELNVQCSLAIFLYYVRQSCLRARIVANVPESTIKSKGPHRFNYKENEIA